MKFLLLFAVVGVLSASQALAQDLRIAVVHMERLFAAHPMTKLAEAKMEKQKKAAKVTMEALRDKLKATLDSYNKIAVAIRRGGDAQSVAANKKRADELAEEARQFERELAELESQQQSALKNAILVERKRILADIQGAIRQFNSEKKFHLVIDVSAESSSGIPHIVDVQDLPDITGEILSMRR